MSWDPTWEDIFRAHDWGRYPPEELIRFVARHFFSTPHRKEVKLLEIGCGSGANIWFLSREGFDVYGIDGSETAIIKATQRLREEGLEAHLQVGDASLLSDLDAAGYFDAVIDVTCVQHNKLSAVQSILDQTLTILKPHGVMFSMMLATGSYGDGLGQQIEAGTYLDIGEGPLHNMGLCHFFSLEEVNQLFARFSKTQIEYSVRSLNNRQQEYKHWVIESVK